MASPTPKPSSERRRRNKDAQARSLPAEGRSGPVPKLPTKKPTWLKLTRDWWETIWCSPMATRWEPADIPSLVRLARLVDTVNRTDGEKSWMGSQQSNLLSEIRQLEDRYGLSPKSRAALRWEIAPAEAEPERGPGKVRRLRAVDPAAAAEG